MNIAKRLQIEPSATGVMNDLAMQKKQTGERIYNLSVGEPMVNTHSVIIDSAHQAMKNGKTHYSPVNGISQLRQAASVWLADFYQANYYPNQILVTAGGKFAIYNALQCLVDPGDEVIIINPYWVSYKPMIELAGGVVKIVDTQEKDGWKVNSDDLKWAISNKTKVLILNNGSNPTGVLYNKKELRQILQLAKDNNFIIISDEVYSSLTYEKAKYISCGSFTEFQNNILLIQSCSKSFAMTGWRVGFACGPENIIKAMGKLQSQSITNTSTISQWAAVTALEKAAVITSKINSQMAKRREVFVSTSKKLFNKQIKVPQSALYCFVSLIDLGVKEKSSVEFCYGVLAKANIAIVPGAAFGKEGYVRFSFGAKENEIIVALEKLANYLN